MSYDEFLIIDDYYETTGFRKIYKFPNGYGASVIKLKGFYGYEKKSVGDSSN